MSLGLRVTRSEEAERGREGASTTSEGAPGDAGRPLSATPVEARGGDRGPPQLVLSISRLRVWLSGGSAARGGRVARGPCRAPGTDRLLGSRAWPGDGDRTRAGEGTKGGCPGGIGEGCHRAGSGATRSPEEQRGRRVTAAGEGQRAGCAGPVSGLASWSPGLLVGSLHRGGGVGGRRGMAPPFPPSWSTCAQPGVTGGGGG